MSTDVAENLFDSIQTIVDKNLENLGFDTTVKGYIIDNSEAANGKYTVKVGTSSYSAYSDNLEHEVGDNVYISILNNDYSETKIIKGKVLSNEDEDYVPEDNSSVFLDMTGDMVSDVIIGQLVANHPEVSKQQVLLAYETFNAESHINYNKIYLSADFRTQLSGYDVVEGNYGLKVVVENSKEETTDYLFDCSQMFGRVYNFFKDTKQSIILDINSEEAITSVSLYFYQVGGSFYDTKQNFLEYENIPSNLFVSNIDFRMGYDSISFTTGEEKLFLTTTGNLSYSSDSTADLERTLLLRWLHWEDSVPAMIDNNTDLDFNISWYYFKKASQQTDEDNNLDNDHNWVLLESDILDDKSFINYVKLDSLNDEEKFKVIITYGENDEQIESDELIFTNQDFVVPVSPEDSGIIFDIKDETNGNYFLYGQDNLILSNVESNILRQIKVEFQNYSEENNNLLNKNEWTITWTYPKENTMIKQCFISSSEENIENDVFNYYIQENYSPFLLNNTIKCLVENANGKKYSSAVQLKFAPAGTNGSEATLIIKPVNNYHEEEQFFQNAIGIGEENALTYKVFLFDANNKEIDFDKENLTFDLIGLNIEKINQNVNDDEITLFCSEELGDDIIAPILQANLTGYVDYTLTASISVPISKDIKQYNYITGVTTVLYKIDGTPYNYNYSEPYDLINCNNESVAQDINWSIVGINEGSSKYRPTLDADTNILKPLPFYVKDLDTCAVLAKNPAGEVLWSQAILINQNCFPSGTVNKWDGNSLQLDEETGSILSPMLVAGKKNFNDNTFSGVMIGDLYKENISSVTGVYGFREGRNTYAFKEDGTAFIGDSGSGRIEFDGESGVIQSGNYENLGQGMQIDLSRGKISANNKLFINSEEYQKILDTDIFNTNQEYYIKSDGNEEYTLVTEPKQEDFLSYYTKTVPFVVGNNFFIQWDGSINATSGVIGNWKIEDGQLQGSGANLYQTIKTSTKIKTNTIYNKEKTHFNLFTLKYNIGIQKPDGDVEQIKDKDFPTWVIEKYKSSSLNFIQVKDVTATDQEINKELLDEQTYSTTAIRSAVKANSSKPYLKVYYFFEENNPSNNPSNYKKCVAGDAYNTNYEYYIQNSTTKEYEPVEINSNSELNSFITDGVYYLDDSIKIITNKNNYGEDYYKTLTGKYYIYVYNSSNNTQEKTKDEIQNDIDNWIEVGLNNTNYKTVTEEEESYVVIEIISPEEAESDSMTKLVLDPGKINKKPGIFFSDSKSNDNNYETYLQSDSFQLKNSIFIFKDKDDKAVVNLNNAFILDERDGNNSATINLPTKINENLYVGNGLTAINNFSLTGDMLIKNGQLKGIFKKVTLTSSKSIVIQKNSYAKFTVTTTTDLSGYIPLGVIRINSGAAKSAKITGYQYINNNKFYVWLSNINNDTKLVANSDTRVRMVVVYAKAVF